MSRPLEPERAIALSPTTCPLCGPGSASQELYPARFTEADFNPTVFSARRKPDRIHYRLVECRNCRLVRSDPVLRDEALEALYSASQFGYALQVDDLAATYGRVLGRVARRMGPVRRLLEVGCGNGFFLRQAQSMGVEEVYGVEPSRDAVANAHPDIARRIVNGPLEPGLFPGGSFDVVCLFQVLDHLPRPVETLSVCLTLLRPGGRVIAFNHNIEAVSARLLGERSPIIDVEHTFLFSPDTAYRLLEKVGFSQIAVGTVLNRYSVSYLAGLVPSGPVVARLGWLLARQWIGRVRVWVPIGNMLATAVRP